MSDKLDPIDWDKFERDLNLGYDKDFVEAVVKRRAEIDEMVHDLHEEYAPKYQTAEVNDTNYVELFFGKKKEL